jgi:hypothetical protein
LNEMSLYSNKENLWVVFNIPVSSSRLEKLTCIRGFKRPGLDIASLATAG